MIKKTIVKLFEIYRSFIYLWIILWYNIIKSVFLPIFGSPKTTLEGVCSTACFISEADAFTKKVVWAKPKTDKGIGIKTLGFGDVKTDIIAFCEHLSVVTNFPYDPEINGEIYKIQAGINEFQL